MKDLYPLLVFFGVYALVLCADGYRHKNMAVVDEEHIDVPYVMGPLGGWVKYAFYEKDDNYDPNEDHSEYTKNFFNEYMNGKYCYATYAPHGDLWNTRCFDNLIECTKSMAQDRADYMYVDTKQCYQPYLVQAWCVRDVNYGMYRYYDDDSYGEIIKTVCTTSKERCDQVQKYTMHDSNAVCHKETVISNKTEGMHLWSDDEIQELLDRNKNFEPLVFKKDI